MITNWYSWIKFEEHITVARCTITTTILNPVADSIEQNYEKYINSYVYLYGCVYSTRWVLIVEHSVIK